MKIALYKGTGWINKIIMWVSRGDYSHSSVLLNDGTIIEAWPGGVRRRKNLLDKMNTNTVVDVFEVDTTPDQDKIIQEFLEKQMGKGYDYLAVIGFVLYTSHQGRIKYERWICSELIFDAFQKVSINLLDRVDGWKISPTILSYSTLLKNIQRYIITKSKRFGSMKHPNLIRPSSENIRFDI